TATNKHVSQVSSVQRVLVLRWSPVLYSITPLQLYYNIFDYEYVPHAWNVALIAANEKPNKTCKVFLVFLFSYFVRLNQENYFWNHSTLQQSLQDVFKVEDRTSDGSSASNDDAT
ncbi:hypothetical protein DOY81_011669, partial [Sarcophaga bullata]